MLEADRTEKAETPSRGDKKLTVELYDEAELRKIDADDDLNEIKDFAAEFVKQRAVMGFSPKDVIASIQNESKDFSITESSLIKFERLEVTPKSGMKMKSVLEKWLTTE
jgi:hypothetical protein